MPSPSQKKKPAATEKNALPREGHAPAADNKPRLHADGSVHVQNFVMPFSDLCSPQLKNFYVAQNAGAVKLDVPARTASKSEWDKFDDQVASLYGDCLAWVLNHYAVDVVDTYIGSVRVGVVSPRDGCPPENRHRVLINLHGGGFVYNRGLTLGQLESIPVAALGKFKVITLDYRQAPFHRYPAATEDLEAVYRHLLEQYSPGSIGIFGCSAGGVLTSQAIAWFQAKGLPTPGAAGVFSAGLPPPYIPGGHGWGEAAIWFSGMPKGELSKEDACYWEPMSWYMEGVDKKDPSAYPEVSDAVLAKFPPTLFLTASRDFAVSRALIAHARFLKLGVDASLYVIEGGVHGAHVIVPEAPEVRDAQAYVAKWFGQHLD